MRELGSVPVLQSQSPEIQHQDSTDADAADSAVCLRATHGFVDIGCVTLAELFLRIYEVA